VALVAVDASTTVTAIGVNQTGILVRHVNLGRHIKSLGESDEPTADGGIFLQNSSAQKVDVTG
jgi:hypothetical protein